MAVSTEGSEVVWVIVKAVTVYVVNVQLTDMYWVKVAVLAVVLAVCVVRRTQSHLINLVYGIAPVSTRQGLGLIPHLNSSGTTNCAHSCAFFFVDLRESVIHLYLLDKGQLRCCHS